MTMSPSGTRSDMDEEAIIEAEIQQQLDLIDLENEDNNNNLGELPVEQPILNDQGKHSPDGVELLEVEGYLKCLQKQTEQFERELAECDDLVNHQRSGNDGITTDIDGLVEEAERSGVDPDVLRNKILEAIEKESDKEDETEGEETTALKPDIPEAPAFVTEDGELLAERKADSVEEFEGNSTRTLAPDEGVVALVDEIQTQEQFFKQQLQNMDRKYREREARWKQEAETRRKLELEKENIENEKRRQIMIQHEQEKEEMEHKRKIAEQKFDEEIKEKEKSIRDEVKKFEEQITLLETETRQEQEQLEKSALERQEKHRQREITSATKIQAGFRGYRVRKEHEPGLKVKREERAKAKEQKRIEEFEKIIEERKQEKNKKKEEEEKEKKEKLQEEEQRKLEEQKQIEDEKRLEEKRLEEERKKQEEEKQKKEEEERLKLEQQKVEEEKRRKEEEARKMEEERKRKEEERQKEEERILNEKKEQERIQKELEERIEREKKEREEKERIERENAQKEKEEQLKIENEEKRLKEEEIRKTKEQKLQEENERLKFELIKLRGESQPDSNTQNIQDTAQKDNKIIDSDISVKDTSEKQEIDTNKVLSEGEIHTPQLGTDSNKADANKVNTDSGLSSSAELSEKSRVEVKQESEKKTLGRTLPEHIEARRLAWIKECLPWSKISNEPWKLKGGVSRKPPRRPSSAKKLSPLAEDVIIAAARVATLKQVTTVQLSDLPGCNLSTLGQCWGLKSLSLPNCSLVALDGLHQCKQLQYLNVQRNKVEYVDLKDLGNLQVVDLSHNSLSVLHGLEGCTNIRWLDLSHNRLTRLGGLSPLRRLHTLDVSSNQLICCSGVSDVPTLQHLTLSNNHLQTVEGISKLCLLQKLQVAANNLLEFPDVGNQVLLSECDVSDNSISSLETLSPHWLPLLSSLNLANNSLNELEVLDNLLLLKNLDISNNQLLDLESVSSAVRRLTQLEVLNVQENPATDSVDYRAKFTDLLPRLQTLDGTKVEPSAETFQPNTDFEAMCRTQEQFNTAVYSAFLHELQSAKSKSPTDDLALCDVYFRYCNKTFKLAVEHRYAHEYGEISLNLPTAPSTPKSGRPRSSRTRLQPEPESYLSPKEMFEKALNPDSKTCLTSEARISSDNPKDLFEKALKSSNTNNLNQVGADNKNTSEKELSSDGNYNTDSSKALNEDAGKSVDPKTSFVGAFEVEQDASNQQNQDSVENTNSASKAWPSDTQMNVRASLQNLPPDEMAILQELHAAATKIQATWRGFYLRLKLSAALEYARLQHEDDISEFDDFNMDEIAFDEESLEKGWRPTDTPVIPHNHVILGKPPSGRRGGAESTRLELAPVHPPNRPRQAWRNTDSPLSDLTPHPPPSVRSGTDTHRSCLSKKEEKLAEEWGFHNSRTAELMLQRAKKMKLNSDKKRKLSRLDPKQRLALYRKLEEATKLSPIRPPIRKTLPRKEYFQAREDEIRRQEFEKRQEAKTRSTRTYEWLHTQVNPVHTDTDRNMEPHAGYGSPASLTSVHHDLTGSGRLQMMNYVGFDADPGKEERKPRRFSSAESTGGSSFLPPIKTGSAGSTGSEGRGKKKEKMSWRSKPTEMDVGWGGGRKRQK